MLHMPTISVCLLVSILHGTALQAQQPALQSGASAQPASTTSQKYQISVLEGASEFRRAKKGRASSQAVIKVSDSNGVPVAGISVTFTIPQFAGGAAFANGGLTAFATTNAAGLAS